MLFGVTVLLYFIKLLSGSHNYYTTNTPDNNNLQEYISNLYYDIKTDYQITVEPPPTNITKQEMQSLHQLKTDKDLIVKPADKGRAIVIRSKDSYLISNHSLIFCVIKAGVAKSDGNYRDINYRCYKNYNQHNFKYDLENVDWSFMDSVSDINNTVNNWCNKFSEIADKHAPIKTRRAKCTNKSPWITPELTELMHERDYHQKQAHKTNLEYHWQQFRELRNLVNNQVKLARSKYYQDSVNANKNNPSNLWKTLNELTPRTKSGTNPSCIISEEKPVTDQKSIATILNEYFTSIGTKLADKIKNTFRPRNQLLIFPTALNSKK